MELDKEKENDKAKSALNAVDEEKEVVIVEKDQMKDIVEEIQVEDNSTSVEGRNGWENMSWAILLE